MSGCRKSRPWLRGLRSKANDPARPDSVVNVCTMAEFLDQVVKAQDCQEDEAQLRDWFERNKGVLQ